MDSPENKHLLWDLTKHLYKAWMPRPRIIQVFEATIREVGTSEEPLLEKNKTFLKVYVEKISVLQPETAEEREHMFEERLQLKQGGDLNVIHVPVPKKTDEEKILDELVDIKKMLHFIMERVQSRL